MGERATRWVWAGLVVALAALVVPAAASGAVRHAAPGGSGPAASCPAANPCEIEAAIEDPSVADGDHIVLADGDYNLTETLTVAGEITVRGRNPGFSGARIISNADPAIFMITPGATVRDLTLIKNEDKGQGFLIANGTLDRAQVIAPTSNACELGSADAGNARIRNTVCSAGGEAAVLSEQDGPGLEFGILENVTAHSFTNQTVAILARGLNNGQVQLTGRNTIALSGTSGPGFDILADDEAGGSSADVTMSNSAYDYVANGFNSSVTPIASGTNIGGNVALVDPGGRDFRQLPNSGTLDAGAPPAGIGPVDFAGDARIQGSAIDIGADEAVDRDRILKLLGKRVKAKRKLRFKGRCQDAACEISGKAVIKAKGKKKTRKLRSAGAAAGSKAKITVKVPKRLAKRLKRKGGRVTLRATGTDAAGFIDRESKRYLVKKRRR